MAAGDAAELDADEAAVAVVVDAVGASHVVPDVRGARGIVSGFTEGSAYPDEKRKPEGNAIGE